MDFKLPDNLSGYVKSLAEVFEAEDSEEARRLRLIVMHSSVSVEQNTRSTFLRGTQIWFHDVLVSIPQALWVELDLTREKISSQRRLLEELEKLCPTDEPEGIGHVEINIEDTSEEYFG